MPRKKTIQRLPGSTRAELLQNAQLIIPSSEDIAWGHTFSAQCYLPQKRWDHKKGSYEATHGNAHLLIQPGHIYDPGTCSYVKCGVPAASAGRVALTHIENHISRAPDLETACTVPMGDGFRDFLEFYGISVGGVTVKEIRREVINLSACSMIITFKTPQRAKQHNLPQIAETIDFWLEKDERQRSMWQPTMKVNPKYAQWVRERKMPIDMRAYMGLYGKPREMDIYRWLCYRLPLIEAGKSFQLSDDQIGRIFAHTIRDKYKRRQISRKAMIEAASCLRNGGVARYDGGFKFSHREPEVERAVHRTGGGYVTEFRQRKRLG